MSVRKLALIVLALFVAVPLFAQIDKAAVEALALDQSKAPLPGVTVTVTRAETGFSAVGVTDVSGIARFVSLAPGTYAVEFTLEGSASMTVGDETREVKCGGIVVIPANTPHRFINSGTTVLRQIGIHASPKFIQTNLA